MPRQVLVIVFHYNRKMFWIVLVNKKKTKTTYICIEPLTGSKANGTLGNYLSSAAVHWGVPFKSFVLDGHPDLHTADLGSSD